MELNNGVSVAQIPARGRRFPCHASVPRVPSRYGAIVPSIFRNYLAVIGMEIWYNGRGWDMDMSNIFRCRMERNVGKPAPCPAQCGTVSFVRG